MSSFMVGSSLTNSTRSGLRKVPCSCGGDLVNASARNSATGRTGVIRKLVCCAAPAETSRKRLASAMGQAHLITLAPCSRLVVVLKAKMGDEGLALDVAQRVLQLHA